MKLDPQLKTAQQLIGVLIDQGLTRTEIAIRSGTSVSTISRTYSGDYADVDYQVGKALEDVIKSLKVKK